MAAVTTEPRTQQPRAVPTAWRLPGLSIVLPCHDEAENVAAVVGDARRAGNLFAFDHEVIVVDDGSTDDTRRIAEVLAAQDPHVRVVVHEHNRGYGAAVRSGIAASRLDWVLLTDGDGQFDLLELEGFVPMTRRNDLLMGFRILRADPAPRRAAAWAWNQLMERTFAVGVRDVDCAFKLARGDALRALPLTSDGAMISTELLVRARQLGWRVSEIGVHHRPRMAGESSGGDLHVVARAFRERRALRHALRDEARGERRQLRLPRPTTT